MDKNDHPLKQTAIKILEDWGMMLIDESVDSNKFVFDPSQPIFKSEVILHGVISGTVSIVAPKNFVETLTRNVLGLMPEDTCKQEELADAFKEMGNILAGNFLTTAYGTETVFDLLHPSVTQIDADELDSFLERNIIFSFIADDTPVAVSFAVKHP